MGYRPCALLLVLLVTFGGADRCQDAKLPAFVTSLPHHAYLNEALQLSKATYDANPRLYLQNKHIQANHAFQRVAVGADSSRAVVWVLAESDKAVYVGLRGTDNINDALVDMYVLGQFQRNFAAIHAGFYKRACSIPIRALVDYAHAQDKTLIFTGHSLGGAVAHVATLAASDYAVSIGMRKKVYSIAFAAPVFGDQALFNSLSNHGHMDRLLTITVEGDLVPSLMAFQFASLRTLAAQLPNLPALLAADQISMIATQFILHGILKFLPSQMVLSQVIDTLIKSVNTACIEVGHYWHLGIAKPIRDHLPFPTVIAEKLHGHLIQHALETYDLAIGDACLFEFAAKTPPRVVDALHLPVTVTHITSGPSTTQTGALSITIEGTNFGFIRTDSVTWGVDSCRETSTPTIVGWYSDVLVVETTGLERAANCSLSFKTWLGETVTSTEIEISIDTSRIGHHAEGQIRSFLKQLKSAGISLFANFMLSQSIWSLVVPIVGAVLSLWLAIRYFSNGIIHGLIMIAYTVLAMAAVLKIFFVIMVAVDYISDQFFGLFM